MNNKNCVKNDSMHTLDVRHSSLLEEFHKDKTIKIPLLIDEKKKLKQQGIKLCATEFDQFMVIKDRVKEINDEIKALKSKKHRYFLENSSHIFKYFEDKKKISSGDQKNVNVLNTFFKIKKEADVEENDSIQKNPNALSNYWKNVDNEISNIQDFVVPSDICYYCSKGELIPRDEEGIMICNNEKCGKFIHYIFDGSKPSNKEPPNEPSYTAYIRLNHFKEILSQFQAKETTQIPEKVLQDIKNRIKKERIKDIAKEINYDKMREILRKLGYNKYFEHIQYINSQFGIRPPIMNEQLHETLCFLFIEIQKPWAVHCPPSRTNFFNYTYTLYQLCVLLDQTQYLPYIPLMKDREKQLEQDQIWCKVCKDLDWEYHPTV
jgi:hypothetical protein